MIVLGRLTAVWGLEGWLKVASYTDPPEALLRYPLWHVARVDGEGFEPIAPLGPREYYWEDLIGLNVRNRAGRELGRVGHFIDLPTGAVMVVQDGAQQHWIPMAPQHLRRVNLEQGQIEVDWTP